MTNQEFANVQTVYILQSGTQITSLSDFDTVKDRFEWLDKKALLTELLHVRSMTNSNSRSIIAVYEEGKNMKTLMNLEPDFHVSDLANVVLQPADK
jgi:hypothetical protein